MSKILTHRGRRTFVLTNNNSTETEHIILLIPSLHEPVCIYEIKETSLETQFIPSTLETNLLTFVRLDVNEGTETEPLIEHHLKISTEYRHWMAGHVALTITNLQNSFEQNGTIEVADIVLPSLTEMAPTINFGNNVIPVEQDVEEWFWPPNLTQFVRPSNNKVNFLHQTDLTKLPKYEVTPFADVDFTTTLTRIKKPDDWYPITSVYLETDVLPSEPLQNLYDFTLKPKIIKIKSTGMRLLLKLNVVYYLIPKVDSIHNYFTH